MELWELVRFLHILALAMFVGGQLTLAVAIVPVLRGRADDQMRRVARRFGIASVAAFLLLLATGIAMASEFALWENETLQAKLAVIVLLAVLTGLHIAAPQSRPVQIGLVASSLLVVWFGVELSH